jgi:perosamine synthetase
MDLEEFQKLFSALTAFRKNRFHPLVWINGEPEIGENVYIGGMSEINATRARVVIGNNCDIATFVSINCADSHKKTIGISEATDRKDIIIEDNVFIGSLCMIKGGSHIGHNSVIAAGTVVNGVKIPPYSLVSGNPMQIKEGYYINKIQEIDNNSKEIPHNRLTLGKEEEQAAIRVIQSGWLAQGKEVGLFENEFCDFLGLPEGHAVALASGTAALYLSLRVLAGNGKRVALPVYSCSSLRHATAMAGAREILIDISPGSPNMDQSQLQPSNVDMAIIPHMFGIPAEISNLGGIDVVEDCAQALGAKIDGIHVGLCGRLGIYSFYATKLMTSGGQGGMVVSKDKALVDAVRDYREFDQRRDHNKRFNFQMTDLQAAIGREQLKKLPNFIIRRGIIFEKYKDAGLDLLETDARNVFPVRYRAVIKTSTPRRIIDSLAKSGIKTIIPIEDWELLGESYLFPRALKLARETVSLPIYPSLLDRDVDIIISRLTKQ